MQKMHSRILSSLVLILCATTCAWGSPPSWWSDSTNGTAILNGNTTNNYAPVSLGQLKYVAAQAKKYLDTALASKGGSGPVLDALVNSFSTNATMNKSPVVLGQLKYVAKPFYDRLQAVGYDTQANLNARITGGWSHIYPWPDPPPRPDQVGYNAGNYTTWVNQQYVPANLGQLKLAFSFDLTGFTPSGGDVSGESTGNVTGPSSGNFLGNILMSPEANVPLIGDQETAFLDWVASYGNASLNPENTDVSDGDADGDHLTNYEEWLLGTDPTNPDTDGDGVDDYHDALATDANFTMEAAAVPNYAATAIGKGTVMDINKNGCVLIRRDPTGVDEGNFNGEESGYDFQLWDNGLIDAPMGYDSPEVHSFDQIVFWGRICDDGTLLGTNFRDEPELCYWRRGMVSPVYLNDERTVTIGGDLYGTFGAGMLYADNTGNIYYSEEPVYIDGDSEYNTSDYGNMAIMRWNIHDNSLTAIGRPADGPVDITIASITDGNATHTLKLEIDDVSLWEYNKLLVDDVVVAENISLYTYWGGIPQLYTLARQFSEWHPQPVLAGVAAGNDSLVYVTGNSTVHKDLYDNALSSDVKTITSLDQSGYATTSDGLLWADGLTQNITDGNGTQVLLDLVDSSGNYLVGHYADGDMLSNTTTLVLLHAIPDTYGGVWPPNVVFSASEYSGASQPKKLPLNGRPLPDGKPQTAPESDHQPEETFIDALTQSLRHNVTDVYSSVAGTDLPMSVNRVYGEEIWATDHGVQPTARDDWPFGPGWRSNIAPRSGCRGYGRPTRGCVCHRRGRRPIPLRRWQHHCRLCHGLPICAYPSSRHERIHSFATLTLTGNNSLEGNATLTLTKKYGTTVTFDYTKSITQAVQNDVNGSASETFHFFRADNAEDHLGNKLEYGYGNSTVMLPSNLTMHDVTGNLIPGAYMNITFVSGGDHDAGLVHTITDSDGKTTTYTYGNFTDSAGCITAMLTNVEDAASGNVSYGYRMTPEMDSTPHGAGYTGPYPIYDHLELSNITDQNGNEYQFQSDFDYDEYWTKGIMNYSWLYGYYPASGRPRLITQVTLPDASIATFDGDILVKTYGGGGDYGLTSDSRRVLNVTDADGRKITYTWSDAEVAPEDIPYALQGARAGRLPLPSAVQDDDH